MITLETYGGTLDICSKEMKSGAHIDTYIYVYVFISRWGIGINAAATVSAPFGI